MCVLAGSALLAALAGAIGSPAEAAPGNALDIPWATQAVGGVSVLPQQFQAGDCHLQGLRETRIPTQARVELIPANSNPPGYWILWDYSMYSDNIWVEWPFSGPDVWHATFVFKDANGAELFHWTADGQDMYTPGSVYTGEVQQLINISTAQFNAISRVDWKGDC
jgi:hypothetical protein